MQLGRLLARPEITLIVEIYAVGNRVEGALNANSFDDAEKLVLTLETALPVIADIFLAIELRGSNHLNRNVPLFGKRQRIRELRARQAGGVGNHRQHVGSEFAIGDPRQISRIHAARVGDQGAAQLPQPGGEEGSLAGEVGFHWRHASYGSSLVV